MRRRQQLSLTRFDEQEQLVQLITNRHFRFVDKLSEIRAIDRVTGADQLQRKWLRSEANENDERRA